MVRKFKVGKIIGYEVEVVEGKGEDAWNHTIGSYKNEEDAIDYMEDMKKDYPNDEYYIIKRVVIK